MPSFASRFLLLLAAAIFSLAQAAETNTTTPDSANHVPGSAWSRTEVLLAARRNLDASIARRGLQAARADIVAADRAPLPVLTAKTSQIDLQNGIGPGSWLSGKRIDKALGLDWTWERGGKRELRTQAAQGLAQAAASDLLDVQLQQALLAQAAFYDLLGAQEKILLIQQIEASSRQLAQTARQRVQAGDLALQDAARVEIEAERALLEVHSAQAERQRHAHTLLSLLGQARPDGGVNSAQTSGLLVLAEWPDLQAAPQTLGTLDHTELNTWMEARADVQAAQARLEAARKIRDAAVALKRNDITWGASLDHYPGVSTRLLELRMQMPLQIGYAYEGEISRAEAQLDAAQDILDKTRWLAELELSRLRQEWQSAARRARLQTEEVLPRARAVAERAELAYQKGAMPLGDLLDTRRVLRAALLDELNTRLDHARAWGNWQLRLQPLSPLNPVVAKP